MDNDIDFQNKIMKMNKVKQGLILLEEIGKQFGQIIAMNDYVVINAMQDNGMVHHTPSLAEAEQNDNANS